MAHLEPVYRTSLALLTDLYQLTMAGAYDRAGLGNHEAAFHLYFRQHPFQGGFTVAAGLAPAIEYVEQLRFGSDDLAYLAGLQGNDGQPLFTARFLDHLERMRLECDIDAVPEGTVVFPREPLLRVVGPLIQAQILETALLNLINFQTLIATKAARVVLAAQGDPVLEFGLRRAQGIDGALAASRAAYLGGCSATSNVLAGKLFGIPVRGTHAHSWVMCFGTELESFQEYARAMPNNCVFLVDTYDTLQGVRHAVEVGRWLRSQGHELGGIRLDSGDLAYLSIEARRMLDEAGFPRAAVIASNDLDEHIISSLKEQGARISVWGVGTRLVTAHDQPALGGVYKLSAIRTGGGPWRDKVKVSEQTVKVSDPGILQVRRFWADGEPLADMIYDTKHPAPATPVIVNPGDPTRRKRVPEGARSRDLLVPVFRAGRRVYEPPALAESRRQAREELTAFQAGIKRFVNPHEYPAGLDEGLYQRKTDLLLAARGFTRRTADPSATDESGEGR